MTHPKSPVPDPAPPEAAPARLQDFLCFAIYSANLAYGRAYKPILDEFGITYTQWIAIVALSEEDHQTVGQLGEKLFLESNTLTPLLKKLEAMGFLQRRRDAADERQVILSLTDAGRRLREEGARKNLVAASNLTFEEFSQALGTVGKLRDNLLSHLKG